VKMFGSRNDIRSNFSLNTGQADQALDKFKGKLGGLGSVKGPLIAAGAVAAIGAAAAVAGTKVFQATAQLELGANKIRTVFGDQLPAITTWADSVRLSMGTTRHETLMLAAGFQDLLVPMGFSRNEAAKLTTETVGLSAALSEWSGGTRSAAEIAQIFSKAMLGEREQMKTLGISITELDVKTKLLSRGQEKLTGNALAQAKAIATQELIFEKSTDAQEAFRKGGNSLARTQQQLLATLKQMKEDVLVALIPAMQQIGTVLRTEVLPQLTELGVWMGQNLPSKIDATVDALKGLKRQWDITTLSADMSMQSFGSDIFGTSKIARANKLIGEEMTFQFGKLIANIIDPDVEDADLRYQGSRRTAEAYFDALDKQNFALFGTIDGLREMTDETARFGQVAKGAVPFVEEVVKSTSRYATGSIKLAEQQARGLARIGIEFNERVNEINAERKAQQEIMDEAMLKGQQTYQDRVMSAMVSSEEDRLAFLKENNKKIESDVIAMIDAMKAAGFTNQDIARVDIYGQVIEHMWRTHEDGIEAAKRAEDELAAKRQAEIGQMGANNAMLLQAMHDSWVAGGMQGVFNPNKQFDISGRLVDIPKAHSGGIIGGPIGRETPIMALGGETVLPVGAKSGGVTINFNGLVAGDPVAIGQEIARIVNKSSQSNGAIINGSAVTS
jgi:hypothetical protein